MYTVICSLWPAMSRWQFRLPAAGLSACLSAIACLAWLTAAPQPATAADPAVKFMAQVGRELMAAARARSPGIMASVIQRYGDVSYIGLYSLGRLVIESIRLDSFWLGPFRVAQLASLAGIAVCLIGLLTVRPRRGAVA